MSEKVQQVLDRVGLVLNDPTYQRWILSERVEWINAGMRTIAAMHPRVSSAYGIIPLVAGPRQSLTQDTTRSWMRVYEVCYNAPSGVRGNSVRMVNRASIDSTYRNWPTGTLASEIKEACIDERSVLSFDVSPPAQNTVQVEVFGAVVPAAVGALNVGGTALANPNEVLTIARGFELALLHYVLAWCYAKDASDPAYIQRSTMHQSAFATAVGTMANAAAASPMPTTAQ
jgi:hypothetical protein